MLTRVLQGSVTRLLRLAAMTALLGLVVMCTSLLWPSALPVIFAMSVGHLIGAVAVACYGLAVLIDARRRGGRVDPSIPPPESSPSASAPP